MSTAAVARRYARALFELARDANKLSAVASELRQFAEAYKVSTDFRQLDQLPNLSDEVRGAIVVELGNQVELAFMTADDGPIPTRPAPRPVHRPPPTAAPRTRGSRGGHTAPHSKEYLRSWHRGTCSELG